MEPSPLKLPSGDGLRPCFRANCSLGPELKLRPSFRYIYIYIEREREMNIYIYIYIYIYREREREFILCLNYGS